MKHVIFVNGPMGVGKTTTCQELKKLLPHCVFLDGDWCWDMSPFVVNEETKQMVLQNIIFLLNQFLSCSQFEYVLFCWVMQDANIMKEISQRLQGSFSQHAFSLLCSPQVLTQRLKSDIQKGKRQEDVLKRSLSYLPLYTDMPTLSIDVSNCTPKESAKQILAYMDIEK